MLLPLSYQANWELVTLWLLERCCQLYTTQLWWDSQVCAGRIPFKPAISIILSITPYSCMRCSCYGQVNFVYILFFASHASFFQSQLILARFSSVRFHLISLFTWYLLFFSPSWYCQIQYCSHVTLRLIVSPSRHLSSGTCGRDK